MKNLGSRMKSFRHLGNAEVVFGEGRINHFINLLQSRGPLFVVTGKHFTSSESWKTLENQLRTAGIKYERNTVSGEPSPEIIDTLTAQARSHNTETVAAIGGGSVLDAGKAIAAMLKHEGKLINYIEGIGDKSPTGATVPMIAIPTTAGTGSEATKNAVISKRGQDGFKRSFRHDAFIPRFAIIDPALAIGCPPEISLACGMDAFCQLLESSISTGATPVTKVLAREGMMHFVRGSRLFSDQYYRTPDELELRGELALAAYCSGLTLANAGLGTIHGLAGPLGALCTVPHGVACGLLLAPVFRRIIHMLTDAPDDVSTLQALKTAGAIVLLEDSSDQLEKTAGTALSSNDADLEHMLDKFETWSNKLPRLSSYGLSVENLDTVVMASSNKNSPVKLGKEDRFASLAEVL